MDKSRDNRITKEAFLKIKEDDIMFITNPGRMGDEDGSTFVVKQNNEFIIYRVDGWMYRNRNLKKEDYISLDDAKKKFPKWHEAWKNGNKNNYKGKYKYLYMGFGNGLSIDNSIYNEFEPFLKKQVEEYLKEKTEEEKEELKYAAIFNVWKNAVKEMIEEKNK